jgi:ribonucleotide reductase alpha subunit
MIDPTLSAKELNALYLHAWEQGIKTLYYQHSMNAAQQFGRKKLQEADAKKPKVTVLSQDNICVNCEA